MFEEIKLKTQIDISIILWSHFLQIMIRLTVGVADKDKLHFYQGPRNNLLTMNLRCLYHWGSALSSTKIRLEFFTTSGPALQLSSSSSYNKLGQHRTWFVVFATGLTLKFNLYIQLWRWNHFHRIQPQLLFISNQFIYFCCPWRQGKILENLSLFYWLHPLSSNCRLMPVGPSRNLWMPLICSSLLRF